MKTHPAKRVVERSGHSPKQRRAADARPASAQHVRSGVPPRQRRTADARERGRSDARRGSDAEATTGVQRTVGAAFEAKRLLIDASRLHRARLR